MIGSSKFDKLNIKNMKKNFLLLGVFCLVIMTFFSCGKDNEFSVEDLYGYWQEDSNTEHVVRFMTAAQDTVYEDYLYAYEWDEGDGVTEDMVKESYHGNGWFRWKLVTSDLTEIHLMDNGGAEIPKVYTVTTLSASKLVYKEKEGSRSYSFTKKR